MKHRPRLAEHARVRRHTIDGAPRVVIHHAVTGALVTLDERALSLALLCDGTRDLDGVCLAAAREGLYQRESEIARLIEALDRAGMLADGVPPFVASDVPVGAGRPGPEVAVVAALGAGFRCSGAGHCCTRYDSYVVSEAELAHAARLVPALAGATPLAGDRSRGRLALPVVDGACAALTVDRRCGIEHAGGASAKPRACRDYPRVFRFDGERVVVGLGFACDCAIESLDAADAEPLTRATRVAELDPSTPIHSLAAVPLAPGGAPDLRACLAFVDRALATPGGAARAAALAAELGLGDDVLEARAAALAAELERAASSADAWRSPRDRTRRVRRAVCAAFKTACARGVASSSPAWSFDPFPTLETRIVGHQLSSGQLLEAAEGRSLAEALGDLALGLLAARELSVSGLPELGHPVAVVSAALAGGAATQRRSSVL